MKEKFVSVIVGVSVVKGQLINWLKFAWANIMQVEGFVPKIRAVGRLIAFLRR